MGPDDHLIFFLGDLVDMLDLSEIPVTYTDKREYHRTIRF
jgi:hypothetical protein